VKHFVFASIALALPGCLLVTPPSGHMSGDAGMPGNDANLAPVSATAACGEIATVACTGYENCCHDGHTVTMNDCITYLQTSCDSRLGAVFRDARTGYDPDIAAEVLAEGRALVAACDPGIIAWYNSRNGLQRAMQGTVGPSLLCASHGDDTPAFFSCSDFTTGCIGDNAAGYYCSQRRTTGLQCHSDQDCIADDYCEGMPGSNPILGLPGQCQRRRANGMSCTTDGACDSYLCDTMTAHACVAVTATNAYCGLH
jgi:hypothetical protein